MIRWTTALILVGLLVAAVLFDRIDNDPTVADPIEAVVRPTPAMALNPPLGSSWFCAIGSAGAETFADGEVIVTNIGDEPAIANLDIRTAAGPGPGQRLEIPARSSEVVPLSNLGAFDSAGVAVEFIGGEGVVSHRVTTAFGVTEGPCASEASDTWFFAGGATTRDTKHYIALLNPFPNDVVFTATFQTPTRSRQPSELEARTVPAQSVLVIDIGEFVAREPVVATTIETVAGGQIVVERLIVVDGALGPSGAALEAGVASLAQSWIMPAGRIHTGGDHSLTVFNPTESVAEVDVQLDPIDAEDRALFGLVPIELTVQPGRSATIDLRLEADQLALPLPYDVGITVTSANGVPVVAHRWQAQPGVDAEQVGANVSERRRQNDGEVPADEVPPALVGPEYAQPTARVGVASSHGAPLASTRWVTGSSSLLGDNGTAIVVFAEEGALVEVRLLIGGSLGSPVRAAVDATGRAVIPIDPVASQAALVVTSDQPIIAEVQLVSPELFDVVALVPTLDSSSDADAQVDDPAESDEVEVDEVDSDGVESDGVESDGVESEE